MWDAKKAEAVQVRALGGLRGCELVPRPRRCWPAAVGALPTHALAVCGTLPPQAARDRELGDVLEQLARELTANLASSGEGGRGCALALPASATPLLNPLMHARGRP